MTLKDLFDKAENGTLTFEQAQALLNENKAKFVDLSEGQYVDKQKYTDDLAARDTRITSLDATVKQREADVANLREQLTTAGTDAEKLTTLGNQFEALQKQYEKDTKAYQKQLKEQELKFAVTEFANKQQFSSNAAKRDFVAAMTAKNLQMDNGVLLGATEFMTAYAQENADAFVKAEEPKPEEQPKPHFAAPTTPKGEQTGEPNPFNFNFAGVRPHK